MLNDDRLFPTDPTTRAIARRLFAEVRALPIISPHGHTDPRWFAENEPFEDPARLFVAPDHYVFRMLYSQGVALEDLGVPRVDGGPARRAALARQRRSALRRHRRGAASARIPASRAL
jgi:glucuronate isomerase